MNTNSEFGKLKSADFWKGLIVAGFSSAITALGSVFEFLKDFKSFNWEVIVIAFIGGLIGYLMKNLTSNSKGQPFTTEKNVS